MAPGQHDHARVAPGQHDAENQGHSPRPQLEPEYSDIWRNLASLVERGLPRYAKYLNRCNCAELQCSTHESQSALQVQSLNGAGGTYRRFEQLATAELRYATVSRAAIFMR